MRARQLQPKLQVGQEVWGVEWKEEDANWSMKYESMAFDL